jgi:hypothetical protein
MQLNKSSKKTKKTADKAPVAAAPEKSAAVAPEVKPKPRALKSSTPKKGEEKVTASLSHHHKVISSPTVTVPAAPKVVTHEDIAKLAHSYWVARGHAHGSPHEDWVRAERELKQQS